MDAEKKHPEDGLTMIGLRVENVRRVKAVTIYPPATGLVQIKGRNASGKSSVLDAIEAGLGGRSRQPEHPIRHGEKEALVVEDLGTKDGPRYRVKRTWTEKGTYLTVEAVSAGGAVKMAKPQEFLDSLCGSGIGFDPLEFVTAKKPGEQVQMLLDVMKLPQDPREIDKQRKEIYNTRTIVNRQLKQAEGHLASLPAVPEGTPEEEVSMADLAEEFNARQRAITGNQAARKLASEARRRREEVEASCGHDLREAADKVARLRAELEEAERDLEGLRPLVEQMVDAAIKAENQATEHADRLVDPDLAEVQQQMADVQATNRHVAALKQRRDAEEAVRQVVAESDALSKQIEGFDQRKAALLAQAEFPMESLGIAEDGSGGYHITYGDVPLADCSSSEKLNISMALAMALNPKVRLIIIREGSLLDEESRAALEKWANANRLQILIEIATTEKGGGGFLIEDGELVEA